MFQPSQRQQQQQQQPFFKPPQSQQPRYQQQQQQQPFFKPSHPAQPNFQTPQQYKNDVEFEELKKHFRDAAQTDNGYVVRFQLSQKSSDCYTLFINYLNRNRSFDNAPTVQVYPKGRTCRILDGDSRLCYYNLLENWPALVSHRFRAAHFVYSIYRFFEDNPPVVSPIETEFKEMEEKYPALAKVSDPELSAMMKNPQQVKSFAHAMFDPKGGEDEVAKLTNSITSTTMTIENELIPEARRVEAEIEAKKAEYAKLQGEYTEALEEYKKLRGSISIEDTRAKLDAALDEVDKELRALKEAGPCDDLNAYAEKYKALNMTYYKIKLILDSMK